MQFGRLLRVALIVLLLAGLAAGSHAAYREGEILVKYKRSVGSMASAPSVAIAGATVASSLDQIRTRLIKLPKGMTVPQAIAQLKGDPSVEYVGPNHVIHVCLEPNDEFFYEYDPDFGGIYWQWGLYSSDNPEAGIQATDAWDIETGSPDVVIAIVDTGIDSTHEDLYAKIVPGRRFLPDSVDPTDTEDDNGHGTFVAGVAAAMTNTETGTGIAGVSWGSMLMPIKVMDATGQGAEQDAAAGIIWAADHGAKIINLSLGGYDDVQAEHDAVDYAYSKGCVIVAASGNDNTDALFYPASYEHVIAVGASNETRRRCTSADWGAGQGSNYGSYLDVVAPGNSIFSTTIPSEGLLGPYTIESGTSAAAPFVAGTAALVMSKFPTWTNAQVINQIEETASDIEDPGWDQYSGWGLIDAYQALVRTPVVSEKIGDLVNLGSGTFVRVSNAVITSGSAMLYDRFYAEQLDRGCGICLPLDHPPGGYAEGDVVSISGTLQTLYGERSVTNPSFTKDGHVGPLAPIGMSTRWVGGARKALKQGVTNGIGTNNISLLVTVWGRVVSTGWTYFYIDDGARCLDGSGLIGLKVITDQLSIPAPGSLVRVTGISSVEQPPRSGVTIPVIRVRRQSDMTAL